MAKPTILPIWDTAETNTVEPDAAHKLDGWLAPAGVPEKPPYQSFNFWQNSVYKWLNEINIKGLLGYDALTDYIADLSYVVGSDGELYQCGINNGPSSSVVNPVGDLTGTWNDIINVTPPTARGYIDGLILSNAADTAHDISMSVGICRNFTGTVPIPLLAAIVKQIDVNWAEGTNDGGFPSGLTLLADTWYHFYIIMSADGTKVDAGFDTSLIATNLLADATDYSLYRYVGSVLTDGSANIYQFIQIGDWFIWKDPQTDFSETVSLTSVLKTIRVPPIGSVTAHFNAYVSGGNSAVYFRHPDADDMVVDHVTPVVPWPTVFVNAQPQNDFSVQTDNGQIAYRGSGANTLNFSTIYYINPRGKDV